MVTVLRSMASAGIVADEPVMHAALVAHSHVALSQLRPLAQEPC
jgi:hypothetical protein